MANIQKTEYLPEQNTSSSTFVDLTSGSTLSFTPGSTDEIWLVFATGIMRSSSTAEMAAEVQMTVNSVMKDMAGHQNLNATTPNGAGYVLMHRITGTVLPQTIKVQFRAIAGITYVSSSRIVVAKIPAGADFQWAEDLSTHEVTGSVYTMLTLNWTPPSSGPYIVMGKHVMRETPSDSTGRSWFEDQGVAFHPEAPTLTGYSNARDPWMPVFCIWKETYAAASKNIFASFRTSAAGAEPSQYGYPKLCAFRADVFDDVWYSLSAAQSTTTSSSLQEKNSLAVGAPSSESEFLTFQSARISADTVDGSLRRSGEMLRDSTTLIRSDHRIDRDGSTDQGYHHLLAVIDARSSSSAHTYKNDYVSPDGATVQIAESAIVVLKYPAASPDPEPESAPFFGMIA